VGVDKVTAIVTDNAANMRAARQQLIQQPQYTHILEFRCGSFLRCRVVLQ
jgi:hypothetical protein